MKRLPYIDEYAIRVDADRATTWSTLLTRICRDPLDPSTAPLGFVPGHAVEGERLELKGRHWFARYRLVFLLVDAGDGGTVLSAQTWAAFPGIRGRLYRAIVIGSGGHMLVVRRILNRVAGQAVIEREMSTP